MLSRRHLVLAVPTLWAVRATAQGYISEYYINREVTLAGGPSVVTIQIGAAATLNLKFKIAQLWISTGSLEFTIERNGTAATTTTQAIQKINDGAAWVPTSIAQAFHTSNVGVGAVVGMKQTVYSGNSGLPIDMSSIVLEKANATVRNLSIRTANFTGTVRTSIMWEERVNL